MVCILVPGSAYFLVPYYPMIQSILSREVIVALFVTVGTSIGFAQEADDDCHLTRL